MKFTKKKLALAIGGALITMSVLVSGCSTGSDKKADTIKIGVVAELTGNNATYGTSITNGIKLAVQQLNDTGGLLGKKIELVVADNKSEPAEAANAMSKLVNQDKAPVVMGLFASSSAIAASNVSEAAKVPFLAVGATNPKVTLDEKTGKVKPNTFRVCFIDPFQGTVGANFILNELKLQKAAVYIDNSSDYAKGLAEFFKKAYTEKGGTVVIEESYLQKDSDFKAVLTKIAAAKPEVIYVPGYYEEVGKIVKQARELGITAPIIGGDGWDSPKLVELAGPLALNDTYFTNHYSVEDTNPVSQAFVEAYTKEYGQKPDALAVLGYDAANILIDAITRAGSTDSDKIREALMNTKDFPAITGATTLDEKHNAVKSAVIIEMKDGKQLFKANVKP